MLEQLHNFLISTPVSDYRIITILIVCGTVVGFINTIAGMATAISYGLFMMMGLPINVANGTTRVGVLLQFLTTSVIFKKKGYLDMKIGWKVGIPVGCGAIIGALLAAVLQAKIIEIVMAILLPIMSILLFIDKRKIVATQASKKPENKTTTGIEQAENNHLSQKTTAIVEQVENNRLSQKTTSIVEQRIKSPNNSIWITAIFTAIGIYGGFTHSGVGLLIIFGSFFMLGLDMIHSNAIKQFAVTIYTPLALIVFIIYGQVNWAVALIYAIGNIIGGVIGSYASIKGGERFIKIFVTIIIITMSTVLVIKQFNR